MTYWYSNAYLIGFAAPAELEDSSGQIYSLTINPILGDKFQWHRISSRAVRRPWAIKITKEEYEFLMSNPEILL